MGTILYAPPEWKKDRIGAHIKKGDLWSLGVIVYVLMVGRLPFGEWKHIENYSDDLWFPKKLKKKLSHECVNFILSLLKRSADKRLSSDSALKHPWIDTEAAQQRVDDLGADLMHGLQSVRQDDKIAKVVGGVHDGKLNMNELDPEQRALVFENMKSKEDVERILKHYQRNTNRAGSYKQSGQQIQPHHPRQPQQPQRGYNHNAYRHGMQPKGVYHAPPPIQKPLYLQHQQQPQHPQNKKKQNNGNNNKDLIAQRSEQIMDKIESFKKQQESMNGNGNGFDYDAYFANLGAMGGGHGAIKNLYNEDLDDEQYELQLKQSLSVLDQDLNEEQKEAELRDMLGDDFEDLKAEIYKNKEHQHYKQNANVVERQITHKNLGNPLNIQCEADEDFNFDDKIVDALCELGLATKNACIRAVLATDSKGVNEAAEWLLNHQNDKGINHQVDVL